MKLWLGYATSNAELQMAMTISYYPHTATPSIKQVDEGKLDATIKEINVKPEQLVIIDLSSDAEDEHVALWQNFSFLCHGPCFGGSTSIKGPRVPRLLEEGLRVIRQLRLQSYLSYPYHRFPDSSIAFQLLTRSPLTANTQPVTIGSFMT